VVLSRAECLRRSWSRGQAHDSVQSRSHSPWRKGGGVIAGGVKFLALVVLPFYLLDQLTKWWVHTHYALEPTNREMLERFMDVVMKNMGFVVLSVVAFIGLIIAWKKNVFPDRFSQWGVALILAGILGNVTDRLVHGYVIDFIQVDLHIRYANPWPTFNVADSCIFIAAVLFIIAGIRDARKPKTGPGEAGTK
jgi:signal peptidase II